MFALALVLRFIIRYFKAKYKKEPLMSRFVFLSMFINQKTRFKMLEPLIKDYTKKGYEALSRLALVNFRNPDGSQRKIFYITDGLDSSEIFSFSDKFNENLAGIFQIDTVSEYKTSGFGFPEQTDLLLAYELKMKRDPEFFIPRYLSFKTSQKILTGREKSQDKELKKPFASKGKSNFF